MKIAEKEMTDCLPSKSVSIIIVNYNTKELTRQCLASIFEKTHDIDFEVIVSDNGSNDGSIEMLKHDFPEILLIENKKNLGFGTANNRGLDRAKGKYILFLNSDTLLLNNAVKKFYDYFESHQDENVGALGCNLKNAKGEIIHSYGQLVPIKQRIAALFHTLLGVTKDTIFYLIFHKNKEIKIRHASSFFIGEVPYVTGADLFVKNDEYARYDERFFMYNEEVDLQLQMHKAGLDSRLIEGPEIIHLEGGSTEKRHYKIFYLSTKGNQQLFLSYYQFYEKNEDKKAMLFLLKLIIILIWSNPLLIRYTYKNILTLLSFKR
ncbi:MAG: glycosyltransferase family 2 protein [Treponema sp.]|nr:glycosyltransferase family 2 protein [Treponema sp.]